MNTVFRAANIEMAFGSHQVLDGVSFSATEAEAIAVVGANGAGKTTLMKILAGVLEPTGGKVFVDGDRLDRLDRKEVARRVAVVPQGAVQVFHYTVLEFVLMGYYARSQGFIPSDAEVDGARAALASLGMADFCDHRVSQLSGGELQRVVMARAMVADADAWLLDEPTASLDMRHQGALLQQVVRHVASGGTAISILHDLALVHRFFDRVIVLAEGQFVADGAPDEVLTPDVVSAMYGVEMERGQVGGQTVWVVR